MFSKSIRQRFLAAAATLGFMTAATAATTPMAPSPDSGMDNKATRDYLVYRMPAPDAANAKTTPAYPKHFFRIQVQDNSANGGSAAPSAPAPAAPQLILAPLAAVPATPDFQAWNDLTKAIKGTTVSTDLDTISKVVVDPDKKTTAQLAIIPAALAPQVQMAVMMGQLSASADGTVLTDGADIFIMQGTDAKTIASNLPGIVQTILGASNKAAPNPGLDSSPDAILTIVLSSNAVQQAISIDQAHELIAAGYPEGYNALKTQAPAQVALYEKLVVNAKAGQSHADGMFAFFQALYSDPAAIQSANDALAPAILGTMNQVETALVTGQAKPSDLPDQLLAKAFDPADVAKESTSADGAFLAGRKIDALKMQSSLPLTFAENRIAEIKALVDDINAKAKAAAEQAKAISFRPTAPLKTPGHAPIL